MDIVLRHEVVKGMSKLEIIFTDKFPIPADLSLGRLHLKAADVTGDVIVIGLCYFHPSHIESPVLRSL